MRKFILTAVLVGSFWGSWAQNTAEKFLQTKTWKGIFKMTVVEKDVASGITISTTAQGSATLTNPNAKTVAGMSWPQANAENIAIPDISNLDPNSPTYYQDVQKAMSGVNNMANSYLQWDAAISHSYHSEKNDFPVDVRNYTCTFQGSKKCQLSIFINKDLTQNQSWFTINGVVNIQDSEKNLFTCKGSIDGQPISSTEQATGNEFRYSATGSDRKPLSSFVGANFSGKKTYTEENKTITIEYNFMPINN